jgi:hypothetical protein
VASYAFALEAIGTRSVCLAQDSAGDVEPGQIEAREILARVDVPARISSPTKTSGPTAWPSADTSYSR